METVLPRVLMVEDSRPLSAVYSSYLKNEEISLKSAYDGHTALDLIHSFRPNIILLDIYLPDITGFEILNHIKTNRLDILVVVITGSDSVEDAVDAMRYGAYDFLSKPVTAARLRVTLQNTLKHLHLDSLVTQYKKDMNDQFVGFIGASKVMRSIYQTIERVAPSKASVFITGESGTGKEVCAEAIHKLSNNKSGKFVPLNCAAIPKDLIESEIFGHVKGAFTGAIGTRIGAVGTADGGTLFLDEICEMDLALQSKLLRFLQTGKFYKVGSNEVESVDIRIICATNRNPLLEVKAGRFREDLYYRLHVIPIHLPPLRERGDDVEKIATKFLLEFSKEENKSFRRFTIRASQLLLCYDWPGNVRQLQNVVRQIVVMNDGEEVTEEMLPEVIRNAAGSSETQMPPMNIGMQPMMPQFMPGFAQQQPQTVASMPSGQELLKPARVEDVKTMAEVEQIYIEHAISLCGGSIDKAARLLDINPSTIYRKKSSWRNSTAAAGQDGSAAASATKSGAD
ncbi:MAG: sigma-54-dependent Fis family transcriptional regulator [Succinivibrionaceae bacterium]|nr:sigma-54-dependent Fis family transcriptional regulator [Succinivibrionaceae bacterium]